MTRILQWPEKTLRPVSVTRPYLVSQSQSGGRTLAGVERVRQGDAPFWRMSISLQVWGSREIMALRALIGRGRGDVLAVPSWDCARSPAGLPDFSIPPSAEPHDDGALFSDGSSYLSRATSAVVDAGAAARATTITVRFINTPRPPVWPDMFLSIADRLYKVDRVTAESGQTAIIAILPPLREPIFAGQVVLWDGARGLWRMTEDGIAMPQANFRIGSMQIDFIEAIRL